MFIEARGRLGFVSDGECAMPFAPVLEWVFDGKEWKSTTHIPQTSAYFTLHSLVSERVIVLPC